MTIKNGKYEEAADRLMNFVAGLSDAVLLDALCEAKEFEMRFVLLCEAEMRGLV